MSEPSLFQRLKERKFVQWAVAYLAGAFVVFQLLDALAEPLGLSNTIQRAVLALVGIGFFITLVLAFYHGEKGRQRVSGPELLMVAALLVVAGVALSTLRPEEEAAPEAEAGRLPAGYDARPAIAVLPCENFSPDPDDAYFASGIHEEILLKLSKLSALRSIGRESVEWYRDHPRPMREMAVDLGVGFVGECSVRIDAERSLIRLTFQLIDGESGSQLWGKNYDQDLTAGGYYDIQSEVARQVVQAVGATLSPDDQVQLRTRPTENTESFRYYLLGRFFWNKSTEEGFRRAIGYFQQALEEDPSYALAYAGIADSYNSLGWHDVLPPDEAHPMATAAAERALTIDEGLSEAYASLARVYQQYNWDWPAAERAYRRALELNPDYGEARQWYAEYLAYMGRHDESIEQAIWAKRLDPLSLGIGHNLGLVLYIARQYDRAIEEYQNLLQLDPEFPIARNFLGLAYAGKGMYDAALAELEKGIELSGGQDPLYIGTLGLIYAMMGKRDEAEEVLAHLLEFSRNRYVAPVNLAMIHGALGQKDEAFEWIEKAYEVRDDFMMVLKVSPRLDSLRSDPRFQTWLHRMGFVP